MTDVPISRQSSESDEGLQQSEALHIAHECGAVSYTPGPMRAIRGVSLTFEQLDAFAARVLSRPTRWWRERADEIEFAVAQTGSRAAMSCFTQMRELIQAVAASPAAPAPAGMVGLTKDEVLSALASVTNEPPVRLPAGWLSFSHAITRALAAKNGLALAEKREGAES